MKRELNSLINRHPHLALKFMPHVQLRPSLVNSGNARLYHWETVTLERISKPYLFSYRNAKLITLGLYDGLFSTEHNRQDASTGYLHRLGYTLDLSNIAINENHFTSIRLITGIDEIPNKTGAMYKYYLNKVLDPAD